MAKLFSQLASLAQRPLSALLLAAAALMSPALAQSSQSPDAASIQDRAASALPPPARENPLDRPAPLPRAVMGLGIEEHVGRPLPMELQFTTSEGKFVQLGDYFKDNKPAVIALVYFKCPVVCDVVMQKLTECYNQLQLKPGKDFNVLYFSFDPTETAADATAARNGHLSNYHETADDAVKAGWQFHTTDAGSARALADAIGFKYRRLENGQFSHPAGVYIATPDGKLSRYFYGFSYPARDMKLALIDASNGKLVRSLGDRIMAFCYMFDPSTGKYSLAAVRVMQVSGIITLICVGSLVAVLFVGERVRRRVRLSKPPNEDSGSSGGTVAANAG